jgi:two-component system sensor histidine kinase MprB
MTLRMRMAATAAVAVAGVVLAIAPVVYLAVRSDLRGEVDRVLAEQAQPLVTTAVGVAGSAAGFVTGAGPTVGVTVLPKALVKPGVATGVPDPGLIPLPKTPVRPGGVTSAPDPGPTQRLRAPLAAFGVAATQGPPQPFTGAGGFIQFLGPKGTVVKSANEGPLPSIPSTPATRAIAAGGIGRDLVDVHVRGEHMRVLTLGVGPGGAVQLAQPLAEVDHELSNLVVILLVVGAAGILAAALLGAVVARTALAPIARFTRRTERLAAFGEPTERLAVEGTDELGRLARSFNRTLDDLERSVQAQRQLVADASHELRTPIASLRANIQVLDQAERLTPGEREALRRDVLDELDELTGLVSDLVELARGAEPSVLLDEVRLDQVVAAAVARTERRARRTAFRLTLQPTLVTGDAPRIDRAVANLLDNALKWSPPGSIVDVTLDHGVLTVRDHGPGFADGDLANVFTRFYRADAARGKPGSGLGLAIVRQAAEAHGGRADAANAPAGGACLTVTFGAPLELLQWPDAGLTRA